MFHAQYIMLGMKNRINEINAIIIAPMNIPIPLPTLPTYICPKPGSKNDKIAAIAVSFSLICATGYEVAVVGTVGCGGTGGGACCGTYVGVAGCDCWYAGCAVGPELN